jgi:DNA-binding response OmpR family regulator
MEADDFVLYPGQEEELSLRIKRLLPGNGAILSEECIHCGDLVVDLASCEVSLKGEVLDLTFREYELLKFLALNRGRTFTREALLNRVWGYDYFGGDRTVDVHIRRLRTKTGDLDNPYIETVRNIGYRFRKKD